MNKIWKAKRIMVNNKFDPSFQNDIIKNPVSVGQDTMLIKPILLG